MTTAVARHRDAARHGHGRLVHDRLVRQVRQVRRRLDLRADADRRLLTDRWRDDARSGEVDAGGDPNIYSFYFRSRFDFRDAGGASAPATTCAPGARRWLPTGSRPATTTSPTLTRRPSPRTAAPERAGRRLEPAPVRTAAARDRRQGHARDPGPERLRRRDPRRRRRRPAARASTATTAFTASRERPARG